MALDGWGYSADQQDLSMIMDQRRFEKSEIRLLPMAMTLREKSLDCIAAERRWRRAHGGPLSVFASPAMLFFR